MGSRHLLLALSILLLYFALFHSSLPVTATNQPVQLAVYSEDFHSSNITTPYLSVGQTFNMSIEASNLPAIIGPTSGGIYGFDITVSYDSSILKALSTSFSGPQCPRIDGCVFDLPANDTFVSDRFLNSPDGTTRLGVVSVGPSHRPDLLFLGNSPGILFQIQFQVFGKGLTPIKIIPSVSQILGYSQGCGILLDFATTDGLFDNRDPFIITSTQTSVPVQISPGSSVTLLVNVTRINSFGTGPVTLLVSGIPTDKINATFNPRTDNLNDTQQSFRSTLTIRSGSIAPLGTYNLAIVGVIPLPSPHYFQYNLNFILIVSQATTTPYTASPTLLPRISNPTASIQSSNPSPPNILASFEFSSSASPGVPVSFTALAVWCSSPSYSLRWDFGDGSTGSANPVTHVYSKAGTFTVTLTVTSNGNSYSSNRDIMVTGASSPSPAVNLDLYSAIAIGLSALTLVALSLAVLLKPRKRRNSRK